MRHNDFCIVLHFYTPASRWRCTDVGTRVIVAIRLDAPDESWYHGPPYAVAESVFDENDLDSPWLKSPSKFAMHRFRSIARIDHPYYTAGHGDGYT